MLNPLALPRRHLSIVSVESCKDAQLILALSLGMDELITSHLASSDREYWEFIHNGLRPDVALIAAVLADRKSASLVEDIRNSQFDMQIPIIVLTANGSAEEMEAFHEAGVIGVILKPFDPLNLAAEIRRMVPSRDRTQL